MPSRASRCASNMPAGPAPTMATCVRMLHLSFAPDLPELAAPGHGRHRILVGQSTEPGAAAVPHANPEIPQFYLYGEPHRTVDQSFLHVESLDDRSRPSEWRIERHAHAELT